MSPFEYLGLRPEANENDVRKAYARLLKSNRPDDDATAFQMVNQAYRDAMELLRLRSSEQAIAELKVVPSTLAADSTAKDVAERVSGPEYDPPYFDFARFMDELFLQLETRRADEALAWLYAQPDLYSISLKNAITMDVLHLVVERQPPLSAWALQSVSDFFDVDNLGPRGWFLSERIDRARHLAEMRDRFKRLLMPRTIHIHENKLFDRKIDEEIVRPTSVWRTALLLAVPGMPSRVRDRILELDRLTNGIAVELMNPGTRALYLELADRTRISPKRLSLSLARSALFGGSLAALSYWQDADVSIAISVGFIAMFFLIWQMAVAGALKLHARLSSAGHESAMREGFALLFLTAGVSLTLHPALKEQWSGIGIICLLAAGRIAVTHARLKAGIPLAVVMWVTDVTLAARFDSTWPFQPGMLGLALLTPLVLVADRIRSRLTEVPISVLTRETKPLALLLAGITVVCLALILAA